MGSVACRRGGCLEGGELSFRTLTFGPGPQEKETGEYGDYDVMLHREG